MPSWTTTRRKTNVAFNQITYSTYSYTSDNITDKNNGVIVFIVSFMEFELGKSMFTTELLSWPLSSIVWIWFLMLIAIGIAWDIIDWKIEQVFLAWPCHFNLMSLVQSIVVLLRRSLNTNTDWQVCGGVTKVLQHSLKIIWRSKNHQCSILVIFPWSSSTEENCSLTTLDIYGNAKVLWLYWYWQSILDVVAQQHRSQTT